MRVYTKLVFDIVTCQLKSSEHFEYTGEVAQCGKKTPDVPDAPPPPKTPKDTEAVSTEARQSQADKAKKYSGYGSNIMTGGLGLTDRASTTNKTLLGR